MSAFGYSKEQTDELTFFAEASSKSYDTKREKEFADRLRAFFQKNQDNPEVIMQAFLSRQKMLEKIRIQFPKVTDEEYQNANNSVGVALAKSLKIPSDKIVDILIRESKLLSTPAQIFLKILYCYPMKGFKAYDPKILELFKKLSDENFPQADYTYGTILIAGLGVTANQDLGLKLLEKSKLPQAYIELAYYYYKNKNFERFEHFLHCAADLDEPQAIYNLGVIAQQKKQYKEAIKLFTKTLSIDPKYYEAQLELARMYLEGWGTNKDINHGIKLMQEIVDKSDNETLKQIAAENIKIMKK